MYLNSYVGRFKEIILKHRESSMSQVNDPRDDRVSQMPIVN